MCVCVLGWGAWGGQGVKPPRKARKMLKKIPEKPRRDANIKNVIISENVVAKRMDKHLVSVCVYITRIVLVSGIALHIHTGTGEGCPLAVHNTGSVQQNTLGPSWSSLEHRGNIPLYHQTTSHHGNRANHRTTQTHGRCSGVHETNSEKEQNFVG